MIREPMFIVTPLAAPDKMIQFIKPCCQCDNPKHLSIVYANGQGFCYQCAEGLGYWEYIDLAEARLRLAALQLLTAKEILRTVMIKHSQFLFSDTKERHEADKYLSQAQVADAMVNYELAVIHLRETVERHGYEAIELDQSGCDMENGG